MATTTSSITLNRHAGAKLYTRTWESIYVELLGAQVRMVKGKKYVTRTIEAGEGEPLILVHGSGGSAESWFRNIKNLADNHRFHVYAIDALYHGFSSKEPVDDPDRVGRQVEHVLDFMDAEGVEKANFEGESMGSYIGFRLALEHPERLLKVVLNTGAYFMNFKREFAPSLQPSNALQVLTQELLENPSPETVRHRMEWLMASPERVQDELVALRVKFFNMPELRHAQSRTGPSAAGVTMRRYEEEDCAKITVPTLVFWTEFNPGNGPDQGEYFASLIPGAKYYCMADAAHWPQYEHPEEHDQVIADFLRGK